jgi:hypothetical protein
MKNIRNLENLISSNMKKNTTISEPEQQSPRIRGEIAAQEQFRIFRKAFVTSGDRFCSTN